MAKINVVHVKGVRPIIQRYSTTGWYASLMMLHQWKGLSGKIIETKIREHQTQDQKDAAPPIVDFDYMHSHGIGTLDVKPCAQALGLD